jgi:dihydroflavonol-4-reductase
MRVMLTGGTGFIGGHLLKALVDAGHEPRLLVRSEDKLRQMCEAQGVDPATLTWVVGDILDPASIDRALEGCDACIHAAAFTTLTPEEMAKAIFPPTGPQLSADDPVHSSAVPYSESKAASDRYARSLQEQGHPVVLTYPAGVTGPIDLGVNVMAGMWAGMLGAPFIMVADAGGHMYVDVRDVAAGTVGLLVPGRGPRRYMNGGHMFTWSAFADLLDRLTGFERQRAPMTREALLEVLDEEAVDIMLGIVPSDDGPFLRDSGLGAWRPIEETLSDTYRWLVARGMLGEEWVPALV